MNKDSHVRSGSLFNSAEKCSNKYSMRVSSNLGHSDTGTQILEVTPIGGGRLEVHDVISQSKPQPSFTHISLTVSLVPPVPCPGASVTKNQAVVFPVISFDLRATNIQFNFCDGELASYTKVTKITEYFCPEESVRVISFIYIPHNFSVRKLILKT